MQRSTFLRGTGGLALSAALALGACAQAAEPALSPADARQQDLDVLYRSLVQYHPDLFANTPEADFLARKAEIEARLAGESDVDFSLDLQSLAALAGDSHTQVSLNAVADQVRFYPMLLTWYDGHWYLTTAEQAHGDLLGSEVPAVNDHSMEAVLESFSALLSADNPVKLRRQEGRPPATFFRGCRVNFRQATIFWIIFLCLIVFLFLDLYFLIQNGESGLYLLLLGLVLLWLIFTFVYFYPLLVRFDNKLLRHVRNAFLLSLTHLGRTICLTALTLAPLLIWMVSGQLLLYTSVFWLLVGFSAAAYCSALLLRKVFAAQMPEERGD